MCTMYHFDVFGSSATLSPAAPSRFSRFIPTGTRELRGYVSAYAQGQPGMCGRVVDVIHTLPFLRNQLVRPPHATNIV